MREMFQYYNVDITCDRLECTLHVHTGRCLVFTGVVKYFHGQADA